MNLRVTIYDLRLTNLRFRIGSIPRTPRGGRWYVTPSSRNATVSRYLFPTVVAAAGQ